VTERHTESRTIVLFDFLASDYPILATVLLALFAIASRNRSAVSWMWNDRSPVARMVTRGAIAALGIFLIWATIFDNWRQLLGFLVDAKDRWRSDLYLYEPPSDAVRAVTWSLLAIAIGGMGYLYARYARGYFIPIVCFFGGVVGFFVLNNLRMTFEPAGPLSERGVDFSIPLEAAMTFLWFAMFYAVMATLIFCAFGILWGPAALAIGIIYRLTIGRETVVEPEMFRLMRERSARSAADDQHPSSA
jgi:hypothetical protein